MNNTLIFTNSLIKNSYKPKKRLQRDKIEIYETTTWIDIKQS
jgi:hypothetical protein